MYLYCFWNLSLGPRFSTFISFTLNSSANQLSPPVGIPRLWRTLCPSGSPLCSILRALLGVTGMCTVGKSLPETSFPLWREMEQGLSRWGTGVAYQPVSQLYVPDCSFHNLFPLNCFLLKVFAFKQEFAPLLIIPPTPLWFHCKSCQSCRVLVSGWAPWQQLGVEWCELHLFPDTDGRIGAFRRNFQEVKTELFVTSESPGPALKTSG